MKSVLSVVKKFGIQAKISVSPEGALEFTVQAAYCADKNSSTKAKPKAKPKKITSKAETPKKAKKVASTPAPTTKTQAQSEAPYKTYLETADIPFSAPYKTYADIA